MFYRLRSARNIQYQTHLDTQFGLGPQARPVQCGKLIGKRDTMMPIMGIRRIRYFRVDNMLRRLPDQKLARNQLNVIRGINAFGYFKIDINKMPKIRERIPLAQFLNRLSRETHTVSPRQLQQSIWLDRSFQVDMQLNLGHSTNECF